MATGSGSRLWSWRYIEELAPLLPGGGGGLLRTDRRRYGESVLGFYRRKNAISSR